MSRADSLLTGAYLDMTSETSQVAMDQFSSWEKTKLGDSTVELTSIPLNPNSQSGCPISQDQTETGTVHDGRYSAWEKGALSLDAEMAKDAAKSVLTKKKDTTKDAEIDGGDLERSDTRPDGTPYPSGLKFIMIMLALCLAVFLQSLDNSIMSTAIPNITDQFQTVSDVGWYGSCKLHTPLLSLVATGFFFLCYCYGPGGLDQLTIS
jgi:hypothetical protein